MIEDPQAALVDLEDDVAGFVAVVEDAQGAGLLGRHPHAAAGRGARLELDHEGHGTDHAAGVTVATAWFRPRGRYHPAMPELPEVETVRRGLERLLAGAVIARVERYRADLRRPMPAVLDTALCGQPVTAVERRAKWLLLRTPAGTMLSHLGMTGTWREDAGPRPHDHAAVVLTDGRRLVYRDPRRFGVLDFLAPGQPSPDLDGIGPEPLGPDFTPDALGAALRGRRQAIKVLLLDQAIVAGVGNIYAQEACFRAGIRPSRAAGRLRCADLERLVACVREVLAEAIEAGGSTISDFRQAGGESGYFQHRFAVYDRAGQPCPTCAALLKGAVMAGRSTVWCPRCQR